MNTNTYSGGPQFHPLKTEVKNGIPYVVLPVYTEDSMTIAGWFHNDRRKAAAAALAEIAGFLAASRSKDAARMKVLADLAQDVLTDRFTNSARLREALGDLH